MECGAPFVMTSGTAVTLQLYVDNWASLMLVSKIHTTLEMVK